MATEPQLVEPPSWDCPVCERWLQDVTPFGQPRRHGYCPDHGVFVAGADGWRRRWSDGS